MLTVCNRYAKTKEDAEETLQEGFYQVFKHIRQFKFKGSFEGWIRKIIVNTSIARFRSRANMHPVISLNLFENDFEDKSDIYSCLNVKEMIQMIQALPTSCRIVFNLFVFEGYKHREIADLLGISEGTSKSNLYDARILLQKQLARQAGFKIKMTK